MFSSHRLPHSFLVLCGTILLSSPLRGDYHDSFESAEPTWKLTDVDHGIRLLQHDRDFECAHSGRASEHVQLYAEQGTYAYLAHEIPRARVIAEWSPSLWIKSDRSGIQLLARIILPRSTDPETGDPLSVLIRGDIYDQVGRWQQLTIRGADQLLSRQVRVLRSTHGPDVDGREAFVDLVVVNALGGPGAVNVWLDDLELLGHVPATRFAVHQGAERGDAATDGQETAGNPSTTQPKLAPAVARGAMIEAGGLPIFPRVIEHNGESLAWLQSLGFNAVRLVAPPTGVQLREATRLGIWLVAPPPTDLRITPAHDSVLAWDLGSGLDGRRIELTRQLVGELRRAELRADRPVVGAADEQLWSYSRLVHFLILSREPLGSSLSLQDYGRWLQKRSTLARPGSPFWAGVQTEYADSLVAQWKSSGLANTGTPPLEPQQLRLLALQVLASGARGLVFHSRSRLDAADDSATLRARSLRAVNLELELIEPWVAGGSRCSEYPSLNKQFRIVVLSTERSQLMMVLDQSPHQQYTTGGGHDGPLPLVVPCHATAPHVYAVEPSGLRPLSHRRVAGGVRITVEGSGPVRLVALTQDPLVIHHLAKTLSENRQEFSKLYHELAAHQLAAVESRHALLSGPNSENAIESQWLQQARESLRHCEVLRGASDYPAAYQYASAALAHLGRVRQSDWEQAVQTFPSPIASPFLLSYASLPWHHELARRLQAAPLWSENVLPAGDFENLDHLRNTGWQNIASTDDSVRSFVELSPQRVHGGTASLCLTARVANAKSVPSAFENSPIRIVSPPMAVRRGQWVRVHGWVDVPSPLQATQDGLMIYDSLGGIPLAERILQTDGWREILLYRVAPRDGDFTLTIELSGLGSACLDDFEISVHDAVVERGYGYPQQQAARFPVADPPRR